MTTVAQELATDTNLKMISWSWQNQRKISSIANHFKPSVVGRSGGSLGPRYTLFPNLLPGMPEDEQLQPVLLRDVHLLLLRNPFSAGSSGCSCRASCRLCSGGREDEPKARVCDLLTLCIKKGPGTCGPARGPDTWTLGDSKSQTPQIFPPLDCEGTKAQRPFYSGSLLGGTSSSCYFVIQLLHHDEILFRIQTSETLLWDARGLSW